MKKKPIKAKEMIKLVPTRHLFESFMSYRGKVNCEKCGQLLPKKLRKLEKEFFLVKEHKGGQMLSVLIKGNKNPFSIHRSFFEPFNNP